MKDSMGMLKLWPEGAKAAPPPQGGGVACGAGSSAGALPLVPLRLGGVQTGESIQRALRLPKGVPAPGWLWARGTIGNGQEWQRWREKGAIGGGGAQKGWAGRRTPPAPASPLRLRLGVFTSLISDAGTHRVSAAGCMNNPGPIAAGTYL